MGIGFVIGAKDLSWFIVKFAIFVGNDHDVEAGGGVFTPGNVMRMKEPSAASFKCAITVVAKIVHSILKPAKARIEIELGHARQHF